MSPFVPAFCKIDVEGAEESVLKGLTSPIPYLSFEVNHTLLQEARKCMGLLRGIGPVTFNCTVADSAELLFPSWVDPDTLYDRLASLDSFVWGDIYARSGERT